MPTIGDENMKRFTIFLIFCSAVLLAACKVVVGKQIVGSGKVITETRQVEGFTQIEATCSADVTIELGGPLAVSIEGEDNILPLLETRVSSGIFTIATKPDSDFRTTKPLSVHIRVPVLTAIRETGSGDVTVSEWVSDNVELETNGSGNIQIGYLESRLLKARLTGSGDINIKAGKGVYQSINTSGSGDFNDPSIEATEVDATTSGSGNIIVWVNHTLSATSSGSGDIRYYGSPQVTKNSTGSGSVERLGDRP
jgi:hypothetical protein